MQNDFPVPNILQASNNLLETIAKEAAEIAVKHFKDSFEKQGFTDSSFIPWPNRNDGAGHQLMQLNNNLYNSIAATSITKDGVEITAGEGLPYAAIHNNGGTITVTVTPLMKKFFWAKFIETDKEMWKFLYLSKKEQLTIKIPQRQYIGESQALDKSVNTIIEKAFLQNLGKRLQTLNKTQ